jgi:hypothetical protein
MRRALFLSLISFGCSDPAATGSSPDAGPDAGAVDAAAPETAAPPPSVAYATRVISFTKGENGGYKEAELPGVVLGPPTGGGCCAGSLDVLSLGNGGEIVLAFDVEIVDGPGPDLVVFENAFESAGDPTNVVAEPAEVAVSVDGVTWTAWPCTATTFPYGTCAGWRPVYATPETPIDPRDPAKAGGDPFDLATIGVSRARFVRIRDMNGRLPAAPPTAGFDLDAVAVLHHAPP